jgi:hypothetical protein
VRCAHAAAGDAFVNLDASLARWVEGIVRRVTIHALLPM